MEYTIGKRERTNFLDNRGRAVDGYRIYYTMSDGTVDYVEVEKAQYKPSLVHEAIAAEVAIHDELMS